MSIFYYFMFGVLIVFLIVAIVNIVQINKGKGKDD